MPTITFILLTTITMNNLDFIEVSELAKKLNMKEHELLEQLVSLDIIESSINKKGNLFLLTSLAIDYGVGKIRRKNLGSKNSAPYNVFERQKIIKLISYNMSLSKIKENEYIILANNIEDDYDETPNVDLTVEQMDEFNSEDANTEMYDTPLDELYSPDELKNLFKTDNTDEIDISDEIDNSYDKSLTGKLKRMFAKYDLIEADVTDEVDIPDDLYISNEKDAPDEIDMSVEVDFRTFLEEKGYRLI